MSPIVGLGAPVVGRVGTLKAESSLNSEEMAAPKDPSKADYNATKSDNLMDNMFIEEVDTYLSAIFAMKPASHDFFNLWKRIGEDGN